MSRRTKFLIGFFLLLAIGVAAAYIVHRAPPEPTERKASSPSETTPEDLEALRSLPYIEWSKTKADPKLHGAKIYDRKKAFPGLNLYVYHTQIRLVDMNGKQIHTWFTPPRERCEYAILLDDGEVLAIVHHRKIMKLDWNSKKVWEREIPAHHDVAPLPDGTLILPIRDNAREYNSYKVTFDSIAQLSANGELLKQWSTWQNFSTIKKHHPDSPLDKPSAAETAKSWKDKSRFSYYHMNTINLLPDTPLGKRDPRFRAGNILTCLRNPGLVVIQDQDTMEIVWTWGPGILDFPHMPSMIDNGNILVFDNGLMRRYSRVLEVEPVSGKIVWEYKGTPPQDFLSSRQGSCQRLPNGNTLICDSEKGRAFELDPQGKLVWEFWHPQIRKGNRSTMYRFIRYWPSQKSDTNLYTFRNLPRSLTTLY